MAAGEWLILPAAFPDAEGELGDFIWTDLAGVEHREPFVIESLDSSLRAFKRQLLLTMPPFPLLYCRNGVLNAVSNRLTSGCELGSAAIHRRSLSSSEAAPIKLEIGDRAFTWTTQGERVAEVGCRYHCSEGLVLGLCGPEGLASRGQLLPAAWTTMIGD